MNKKTTRNSFTPRSRNGHRIMHDTSNHKEQIARDKISRVFRYLEALNQHRNPVQRQLDGQLWSLWLHDLPVHPSIIQRSNARSTPQAEREAAHGDRNALESFVFKVQRPALNSPPPPPQQIASWLKDGWDDPAKEAAFRTTGSEGEAQAEKFTDIPSRLASFQRWRAQRDEWARNERPARAAMKIFEALYELHGRLDREAERVELILGDGILNWRRAEGTIYHPVLLQRLQLEFNPAIPEFTLSEADHPVELYSALFQSLADVDGRAIGRCREELEQGGYHPLDGQPTSRFLKRLVVQLSPRGEFSESEARKAEESAAEEKQPRISRDPVVFLRDRTLGFAAAIEGVLEDLRTRRELPWALLNIVGEAPPIFAA